MSKRIRRSPAGLLAAALVAAAALVVTGVSVAADETEVLRVPVMTEQYNPCLEEDVALTGTMRVTEHTTTGTNGEVFVFNTYFTGFKGIGVVTGSQYIYNDDFTAESFSSASPPPLEFTAERTLVLNRLGDNGTVLDDFLLHVVAHMTVSASGNVTMIDLEFQPSCH